jgi:hypothetical protein
VWAHNAAIATYKMEQVSPQQWTLTISMPLGGLHLALLTHYEEAQLWLDDGEYNAELAINYLQAHSVITANGSTPITLKPKRHTLDNHQSDFVFELIDMPAKILNFTFDITAMAENPGHMNMVRIFSPQGNKKVILQGYNNYQGNIEF